MLEKLSSSGHLCGLQLYGTAFSNITCFDLNSRTIHTKLHSFPPITIFSIILANKEDYLDQLIIIIIIITVETAMTTEKHACSYNQFQ